MTAATPIRIPIDPANPGQFFACCGLLELADRLWHGAEGWFEGTSVFFIAASHSDPRVLMAALATCGLANTMTAAETARLEHFSTLRKAELSTAEKEEKSRLEAIRREKSLVLGEPFGLQLDWWLDDRGGGSRFKTWAGQQSVIDIATSMKESLGKADGMNASADDWMEFRVKDVGLPFNFDSDLGPQAAALDVGFSLDPLGIGTPVRPLVEFAAFIGLQRFRPFVDPSRRNRYRYVLWQAPLLPAVAAVAASGSIPDPDAPAFEFPLLYRTKYLKSFLPAQPWRNDA